MFTQGTLKCLHTAGILIALGSVDSSVTTVAPSWTARATTHGSATGEPLSRLFCFTRAWNLATAKMPATNFDSDAVGVGKSP